MSTTTTRPKTIAQAIAETLVWLDNLRSPSFAGDPKYLAIAERQLAALADSLPHGSGIDNGTKIDDTSTPARLVLTFGYHHMNDCGMYDGWTDHTAIVTPTFSGFDIRITGRNRNDIKDYLHDTFSAALSEHWTG